MSRVVVITGGIGSGKSLVSSILASRGIPVYDCDSRAKALYLTHPELAALLKDDIFSDTEALQTLEQALFPVLMDDFNSFKSAFPDAMAVGFESATVLDKRNFDSLGDVVIYVDAPENVRLERAVRRGTIPAEDVARRMKLQNDHSSDPRVTYVLRNDSTVSELESRTIRILEDIIEYDKRKN